MRPIFTFVLLTLIGNDWIWAQQIPLNELVSPSTVIIKDGKPLTFALHGFIEFKSLAEMFPYVEAQAKRWPGALTQDERQELRRKLLRHGIESRVASMLDERPMEALITHTRVELQKALAQLTEP